MRDGEQSPTTGDVRLTYQQIAARLGISGEAARQLVRRRNWQRIKPNRLGAPAIIVVPEEELAGEDWRGDRPTPPDDRGSLPKTSPVNSRTSPDDRLQKSPEINGLIGLLTTEHERADQAEAAWRTLQAELVAEKEARARAEGRAEALQERINTLQSEVEQARTDARADRQVAEELRQAEAKRRACGRLRRVLTAWRGD